MTMQLTLPLIFDEPPKQPYEYFLLIFPGEAMEEAVERNYRHLRGELGLRAVKQTPVTHVPLFKFKGISDEAFIFDALKQALANISSFRVDLEKLDVLLQGRSRSIVSTFKNSDAIKQLYSALLAQLGFNPIALKPHLNMIPSLAEADFYRITNLGDYFLDGSFVCDKISVLRRPLKTKQRFEVIDDIYLQG